MMIRINLLPVRQVQKREQGRQFLVLMIGSLIISGLAAGYWYMYTEGKRAEAQRRLDDTNAAITALEKTIGEVNKLEARRKELLEKQAVLDKLTRARTGPVKVLDAIATAIPKKVWLTSYVENNGAATMDGNAESLDDLSEYMRNLGNIAWTPKGMARILERKRDDNYRVELVSDASQDEFPKAQVTQFFQNIELKQSVQENGEPKSIKFNITLNVQLAI